LVQLRRPSAREIEVRLRSQQPQSYPEVGLSAELDAPDVRARLAHRYDVDLHARGSSSTARGRSRRVRSSPRSSASRACGS